MRSILQCVSLSALQVLMLSVSCCTRKTQCDCCTIHLLVTSFENPLCIPKTMCPPLEFMSTCTLRHAAYTWHITLGKSAATSAAMDDNILHADDYEYGSIYCCTALLRSQPIRFKQHR